MMNIEFKNITLKTVLPLLLKFFKFIILNHPIISLIIIVLCISILIFIYWIIKTLFWVIVILISLWCIVKLYIKYGKTKTKY